MSRFLSARFAQLAPYIPGEQPRDPSYVKLNTNESPFPPAPGVLDAVGRAAVGQLNLYPDPTAQDLHAAIAQRYGLQPGEVLAGNGSDEILAFCFQAFCDQRTDACFADITYGFYPVYAALYSIQTQIIPLEEDFSVPVPAFAKASGTIFLANPNAPTGKCLPLAEVEKILQANTDRVVVMDEAYIDFGGKSAATLVPRYDNLVVVMTFSKSRNLAGARIGFALGQRALIDDLRKMKYAFNPYNLNRLSLLAGVAAMEDESYFQACTKAIMQTRNQAMQALRLRGFTVLDSSANFVFARPPRQEGAAYYQALKAKGILIRHFDAPRTRDYVRITIGTPAQMQTLLTATDEIMQEAL